MTLTITHNSNASASGIVGGLPSVASKGIGSLLNGNTGGGDAANIFGSLLATLFSLTAPQGEAVQAPKITSENLQALSETLLNIQQSLEGAAQTGNSETAGPDTALPATQPLELLANLLDTLTGIAAVSDTGATINPGAIARATETIESITRLLDAIAQRTPEVAAPASPASSASQSPALGVQTQTAALPGAPLDTQPATTTPVAQNTATTPTASTKPESAPTPAPNQAPAPLPKAVEQLLSLAAKLTDAAPDLSAKLNGLAEKLQQLTPQSAPQQALAEDAELNQVLQSLIGARKLTGPAANLPSEGETPVFKGLDSGQTKPTSLIDTPRLDAALPRAVTPDAKPAAEPAIRPDAVKPDAPAANLAAAAAASTATAAKSERGPQSDPLLLAQATPNSTIRTDSASAVKPVTSAYQAQTQTPNLPNIAFEIARQHAAGLSKFQIRMDPPEMGKIDVRLNVDNAGNLHARLTVERAETLDLLQRDARTLEKALQQAGLENRSTNLEFSLRQNPFARQDGQFANHGRNDDQVFSLNDEADTPVIDLPPPVYYRGSASPGGINMFA